MIDTKARWIVDKPIQYITKIAVKLHIKPNQLTFSAFGIGMLSCVTLANEQRGIALMLLWVSGILDVLDGQVARVTKNTSTSGALLDMILDRMVEAFFILALVIYDESLAYISILFLTSVIFNFSTFLAAGALIKNNGKKSMHYDVGLIERTETFIFFTLAVVWNSYALWIIGLLTVLIFMTGLIRFIKIYKLLETS